MVSYSNPIFWSHLLLELSWGSQPWEVYDLEVGQARCAQFEYMKVNFISMYTGGPVFQFLAHETFPSFFSFEFIDLICHEYLSQQNLFNCTIFCEFNLSSSQFSFYELDCDFDG